MAAGAEAETSTILSQAEDEGWVKAELYVRPSLRLNGLYSPHLIGSSFASDLGQWS
jgi:hypothetical protein